MGKWLNALGRATCGILWFFWLKAAQWACGWRLYHITGKQCLCVLCCVCVCCFFPGSLAEQMLDLTLFPRFQCFPIRQTDPPKRPIKSLELLCGPLSSRVCPRKMQTVYLADEKQKWLFMKVLPLMHALFITCKQKSTFSPVLIWKVAVVWWQIWLWVWLASFGWLTWPVSPCW